MGFTAYLSGVCLAIFVSCSALTIPDGYLILSKTTPDSQHPSPTFYQIKFDGTVTKLWSYTLETGHLLTDPDLFAVDAKRHILYLGVSDQMLGLGLSTGKVVVNKTLQQDHQFWNYNYVLEENAIYGMCGILNLTWCRIKLSEPEPKMESLYQLPGILMFNDLYYMDTEHQSLWYFNDYIGDYVSLNIALGFNYTTGENIFSSNASLKYDKEWCLAHDHKLDKTFSIAMTGNNSVYYLVELHPTPQRMTQLLTLPSDMYPSEWGACAYDQETHTLILLMSETKDVTNAMPMHLAFINVVSPTYKSVPLAVQNDWKDKWPLGGVKYIKT